MLRLLLTAFAYGLFFTSNVLAQDGIVTRDNDFNTSAGGIGSVSGTYGLRDIHAFMQDGHLKRQANVWITIDVEVIVKGTPINRSVRNSHLQFYRENDNEVFRENVDDILYPFELRANTKTVSLSPLQICTTIDIKLPAGKSPVKHPVFKNGIGFSFKPLGGQACIIHTKINQ